MSFPLTIHLGNSPALLTQTLARELEKISQFDPMRPLWVGVDQAGMDRALEWALTERWGVNANVRRLKPIVMLANVAKAVVQEREVVTVTNDTIGDPLDALLWLVLAALREVEIDNPSIQDVYQPLRQWFHRASGANPNASGRLLMQLAMQLRQVFVAYQTDRPQWHEWWIHGDSSSPFRDTAFRDASALPTDLAWQVDFWRRVNRVWPSDAPPLVDLVRQVHAAPAEAKEKIRQEVQALHIFGLTRLSELERELINALRSVLPIYLYVASPTPIYWSYVRRDEAKAENISPLLVRFGQHARFLHDTVVQLADTAPTVDEDHFDVPAEDTLLHYVQKVVVSPDDMEFPHFDASDDTSIAFHRSHGPLRQVEVLHDAILLAMQRDPTLEPTDISVLCPRLPDFAPYIDAVFRTSTPAIPFRIEDQAVDRANSVADTLLRVLALTDQRISPREIAELLTSPALRERFHIANNDLAAIHQWLNDLDVRWGWNTQEREHEGRPGATLSTWESALQRLAMGIAMDDQLTDADELPLPPFSDNATNTLLLAGKVTHFIHELFAIVHAFRQTRTFAEWADFLVGTPEIANSEPDVLSRLVLLPPGASFLRREVYSRFQRMKDQTRDAGLHDTLLDGPSLRTWIETLFGSLRKRLGKSDNAVSFAELRASRFAESRVTFLLGMDDGSFPRPTQLPSWDLRQHDRRANDTSPRDEDLYALLQALLLTKDHFAVIYQSADTTNHQELPPALPVLELQRILADACQDGENAVRRLTTEHRLYPFSVETFFPQDRTYRAPFTFRAQWMPAAMQKLRPRREDTRGSSEGIETATEAPARIDVRSLAQAFMAPHATFLRNSARLDVEPEAVVLADDDTENTRLDAYSLRSALLAFQREALLNDGRPLSSLTPSHLQRLRAAGVLQPGKLGESIAHQDFARLTPALDDLDGYIFPQQPADFRIAHGHKSDIHATQTLTIAIDDHTHAVYDLAPSSQMLKALLELWAQVCTSAVDEQRATTGLLSVISPDGDCEHLRVDVEPDTAQEWLDTAGQTLAQIYQRGGALPGSVLKSIGQAAVEDDIKDVLRAIADADPATLSKLSTRISNAVSDTYDSTRRLALMEAPFVDHTQVWFDKNRALLPHEYAAIQQFRALFHALIEAMDSFIPLPNARIDTPPPTGSASTTPMQRAEVKA